jgi:preprotein translocase subunit SecA
LGLTLGVVTQPMQSAARRDAYECNVTYCTAKELGFDYLRDRIAMGGRKSELERRIDWLRGKDRRLLLRGLFMAVIDEADSILIDEARTPLILSQSRLDSDNSNRCREALELARDLELGRDFRLDLHERTAELTAKGKEKLFRREAQTYFARAPGLPDAWQSPPRREEMTALALCALYLCQRDRDYLVHEGGVRIIDQNTGRVAEGRVWSRGLHRLIELKENCKPSGEHHTIAQITYQRLFPRYLRLAGMSGTLTESRAELLSVYKLRIVKVPLRRPSQRRWLPLQFFTTREAKWDAVLNRVIDLHSRGRPILVGTDSVADSEFLSTRLRAFNLPHNVLNARQHKEEARIVAQAGQFGSITVTTNMAGRGTDIALGAGVAALGGLHVICCQHNCARRIDRQLYGRCARQGDPGSAERILSLQDELVSRYVPGWLTRSLARKYGHDRALPVGLARILATVAQRLEEQRQQLQRLRLLKQDALIERQLSFTGFSE